jgi:GNAT superfamily N-acetyltransferase
MNLTLGEVDFSTVLPIWSTQLWPGRQSPIRPVSTMVYLGGKDQSIATKYTNDARFWAITDSDMNGQIVGVFSGHPTSETHYRARGLYVLPAYQRLGVGVMLVNSVVLAASAAQREVCWCIPRVVNTLFFEKCGFVQTSLPTIVDMEFGPNVYMARALLPF